MARPKLSMSWTMFIVVMALILIAFFNNNSQEQVNFVSKKNEIIPVKKVLVKTPEKTLQMVSQVTSQIVKKHENLDLEDDLYLLRNLSPEDLISMANQLQMEISSDEKSLERIQSNRSEEVVTDEEMEEVIERVEKQKQRVRILLDFVGSENYYLDKHNKAYLRKHSETPVD